MERFGMVDINKIVEPEHKIKKKPNKISKQKFGLMLEKFGQFESIAIAKVNGEFKIVDGHELFMQLKEMKFEKVHCCYLGELTEKDYLIYRMFLNSNQKRLDYIGIAEIINKIGLNENDLIYISNKTGMPINDIRNYKELLEFDWDAFLKTKNPTDQMNIFDLLENE